MEDNILISSDSIYHGKVFDVRKDIIRTHHGGKAQRDVVEHVECVAAIVPDSEGKILFVKQYRHAAGKALLEIPAGMIDTGETPEETVIRELQEEIGFLPQKVVTLGGFYTTPGFCNEYMHIFLCEDLIPSRLLATDTDTITLVRKTPEEVDISIRSGELQDAKSIAAVYQWLIHRNNIR